MYKVIIVEDELFVRLGIKNSITWEQYDMQIVADVENGQTAWEKIQKYSPDIIITDILMPVIDGRQLISRIKESGMDPYIIVITCMEDFHLVKDLLSLGIRDYILKATITEEELGECLKKAQNYLEKNNRHLPSRDKSFINAEDQCNQVIRNYLQGTISAAEASALLNAHHINLTQGYYGMALCYIEAVNDYQANPALSPAVNIYQNFYDLLRQRSYTDQPCYTFLLDNRHFILILTCSPDISQSESKQSALETLKIIHDDLQDYLNIRISFLIDYAGGGLASLKDCYFREIAALEKHYLNSMNSVVCCFKDTANINIEKARQELNIHREWISRCLGHAAAEQYGSLINELCENAKKSREGMTYSMMSVSHFICSFFQEHMEDEKKQCDKQLAKYPYLLEGITALNALLTSCEQYYLQYRKPHYRKEIEKALKIINEEYRNQDLSLTMISERVGLSETYFSTLFKQEMEQPFVKYLSNVRVERAKHLLKQTDLKIFDIAMQSGFSDEAYFSRVFKKVTNVSPSEWRSLWYL